MYIVLPGQYLFIFFMYDKIMSKRDDAIEILKKQIREQRARIDPEVLKKAAASLNRPSPTKENKKASAETVPYDREAAHRAVELFLQNGGERREAFCKKLLALSQKTSQ